MLEKGYRLWQTQYSSDNKEGFHAWFWLHDKPDVEVVTHKHEIQEAIFKYYRYQTHT